MSLCVGCEKVVQTVIGWDIDPESMDLSEKQGEEESVKLDHCTSPAMFQEALVSKCWMCNLAWKPDHDHNGANAPQIPDCVPQVYGSLHGDGVQLEFSARSERVLFYLKPRFEFASLSEDGSEDEDLGRAELESECAEDTSMCSVCFTEFLTESGHARYHSLRAATGWLKECLSSHAECRNEKETKQYFRSSKRPPGPQAVSFRTITQDNFDPTGCSTKAPGPTYSGRLIDLGQEKVSIEEWCLIEVGKEGMDYYTYATLSHRWASYEPLLLNAKTRAGMLKGMPLSVMPANYQDAARITKALGIRYLWIDTLCIFQDDELDIQDAACNMAVVYSGSVFNIAAMTTESSGILSNESSSSPPDVITYCKVQSGRKKCYQIWHSSVWHKEVATMPLYRRGWIAQEQILPSRQLLCGSERLFWSCRKSTKYETSLGNVWAGKSSEGWADQISLAKMLDPGNEWHSEGPFWDKFVNQYTWRDLTNAQDKLLAVSGIAKFLQDKTLGLYMAGHWESALPDSLLWQAERQNASAALPIAYRAPSWSWASVEGIISCTPGDWGIAQYLEAWVKTKNGSPFGFVSSEAYMELRGPFFTLARTGNQSFSLVDYEDYPISVELDHRPNFHEMLPYFHLLVMDLEKSHVNYGFRGLLLQRVKPSRSLGRNFCEVKSSILKDPAEAEEEFRKRPLGPAMYERIGLVKASLMHAFASDGSLIKGGSTKSTLFGSMLQRVRVDQQYRSVAQRSTSTAFEDRQLDSYWKDVVII